MKVFKVPWLLVLHEMFCRSRMNVEIDIFAFFAMWDVGNYAASIWKMSCLIDLTIMVFVYITVSFSWLRYIFTPNKAKWRRPDVFGSYPWMRRPWKFREAGGLMQRLQLCGCGTGLLGWRESWVWRSWFSSGYSRQRVHSNVSSSVRLHLPSLYFELNTNVGMLTYSQ